MAVANVESALGGGAAAAPAAAAQSVEEKRALLAKPVPAGLGEEARKKAELVGTAGLFGWWW